MDDFVLIAARWFLDLKVTTYDEDGNVLPDDGEYQRRGAEEFYVFAEFLRDKGLLREDVGLIRYPGFELRISQLTKQGQEFSRTALDSWTNSLDRAKSNKKVDAAGLERRWSKFLSGK